MSLSLRIVRSSRDDSERDANVRAGVLLLYAHWEGWVKAVGQYYVHFLNTQKVKLEDLSDPLLGYALKTKLNQINRANRPGLHAEFAKQVRSNLSDRATLEVELIDTHSNLSSKVYDDIVTRLGLSSARLTPGEVKHIDGWLVFKRNEIAHGRETKISPEEFVDSRDRVMTILQRFTDSVSNSAATSSHLQKACVEGASIAQLSGKAS